MITYIIIGLSLFLYYVYRKLSDGYMYWERKGVHGPKPHWLIGNMGSILKKDYALRDMAINLYRNYQDKLVGFYIGLQPMLLVNEPKYLKRIFVQDFGHFVNHGFKINDGPLARNLFEEEGDSWRIMRQGMTPMFTTGKIKNMMPLLNDCVKAYMNYIDEVIEKDGVQEVKRLNNGYTFKAIIATAFGIDIDVFSGEKHKFQVMAEKFISPALRGLASLIDSYVPGLSSKIIRLTSVELTNFFVNFTKQMVKHREGKPKQRNDFMDLMIKMKEEGTVKRKNEDGVSELVMTDELMAAQSASMYVAGMETSSNTMSFLLYELASNPKIQECCYNEVKQVMEKHNGTLDYESLSELKYITMAFDETLRKYPIASELLRECGKKYTFPDTDITIDKGVKLLISIYSIQHDPKYFPDPEKFEPERFAPENKDKIQEFTYLPFGEGPRICIGMRFAKVQSVLGIAHFLYRFRVEQNEKTVKKIRFDPQSLILTSIDELMLTIKRR